MRPTNDDKTIFRAASKSSMRWLSHYGLKIADEILCGKDGNYTIRVTVAAKGGGVSGHPIAICYLQEAIAHEIDKALGLTLPEQKSWLESLVITEYVPPTEPTPVDALKPYIVTADPDETDK